MQPISREDRDRLTHTERQIWKDLLWLAERARMEADERDHHTVQFAAFDIVNQAMLVLQEKEKKND